MNSVPPRVNSYVRQSRPPVFEDDTHIGWEVLEDPHEAWRRRSVVQYKAYLDNTENARRHERVPKQPMDLQMSPRPVLSGHRSY